MKYLMNSASLSAIVQLLDVSQILGKVVLAPFCVTTREKEANRKPWPFAWGYWYAWTLSLMLLTMLSGCCVPAVFPVATVFFFVKFAVDRYNLSAGRYAASTDAVGTLGVVAVRDMRNAVGIGWLIMGSLCCVAGKVFPELDTIGDNVVLMTTGVFIVILSIVLICFSRLNYQQYISHFTLH